MDKPPVHNIYEFGDFRLDAEHLMLYRQSEEVPLAPKAVETLIALIESDGRIISKDELIGKIWPDAFVEEANLYLYLSAIRKTLGNQQDGSPYLETLRKRGYRFTGSVRLIAAEKRANGASILQTHESVHVASISRTTTQTRPIEPELQVILAKPQRSKRSRRLLLVAACLIVVVVVAPFAYLYFANPRQIESIAVMPISNESGDPELDQLSDDLTEMLIANVSKLPDLQVKASSSVSRYKGITDTPKIGQELGARAILYGKLSRRGDDLALQVELVDTQTQNRLWDQTYNKPNLIELQGDVARDLVSRLSWRLSGADARTLAKNPTENVEAYQLYLRGQTHIRKLTRSEIREGIGYLQRAIALDPSYALAYAGVADAYRSLAIGCGMQPADVLPKAKAAAEKAIELDPSLAEGYAALAGANWLYDWNRTEADENFRRAIALNPNLAGPHQMYGDFLQRTRRLEESRAQFARARELEPHSAWMNAWEANSIENPELAVQRARYAIELDPDSYITHMLGALTYQTKKMNAEAITEMRRAKELSPEQTWTDVQLARMLVQSQQTEEARAILDAMLKRVETDWVSPASIGFIYGALGDKETALAWFEKGYEQRDPKMTFLGSDPNRGALRNDPRYQELVRRIGFAATEQEDAGYVRRFLRYVGLGST